MAAQVIELILHSMLFGQECLNRLHYVDTTGVADPAVLRSDFINDVIPTMRSLVTSQLTFTRVDSRKVYPTADLVVEQNIQPAIAGANTSGDPLPSYAAASAKWAIGATVVLAGGFTGHIKKGGMRLPGMTEDHFSGNGLSGSFATDWATMFAELKDPGTDAFLLCVASYLSGNSKPRPRQQTVQAYALVTGSSDPSPSTQNSRKVLRGRTF